MWSVPPSTYRIRELEERGMKRIPSRLASRFTYPYTRARTSDVEDEEIMRRRSLGGDEESGTLQELGLWRIIMIWVLIFLIFPALAYRLTAFGSIPDSHVSTHQSIHHPALPKPPPPHSPQTHIPPFNTQPTSLDTAWDEIKNSTAVVVMLFTLSPDGGRPVVPDFHAEGRLVEQGRRGWLRGGTDHIPNLLLLGADDRSELGVQGVHSTAAEILPADPTAAYALAAVHLAHQRFPQASLYVFAAGSTYLFLEPIASAVSASPGQLLYTGRPFLVTSCGEYDQSGHHAETGRQMLFAHLGAGAVLSRTAVERVAGGAGRCARQYGQCVQDMQIALCLADETPTDHQATFDGVLNMHPSLMHFHADAPTPASISSIVLSTSTPPTATADRSPQAGKAPPPRNFLDSSGDNDRSGAADSRMAHPFSFAGLSPSQYSALQQFDELRAVDQRTYANLQALLPHPGTPLT